MKFQLKIFFPLRITIPKIGLEWIVYEGTDTESLKKGPGHMIEQYFPVKSADVLFRGTGQHMGHLSIRLIYWKSVI